MSVARSLLILVFSFVLSCPISVKAQEENLVGYLMADAADVVPYIETLPGKRLIFIYTSWCPYCREKFPEVLELAEIRKDSVLALSVDNDTEKLVRYFQNFEDPPFQPMIVRERYNGEFRDYLAEKFGTERGSGIPYMIVLDEQNKVMRAGNFPVGQAAQLILDEKEDAKQP